MRKSILFLLFILSVVQVGCMAIGDKNTLVLNSIPKEKGETPLAVTDAGTIKEHK